MDDLEHIRDVTLNLRDALTSTFPAVIPNSLILSSCYSEHDVVTTNAGVYMARHLCYEYWEYSDD